jgi:hypothetical protein
MRLVLTPKTGGIGHFGTILGRCLGQSDGGESDTLFDGIG